MSEELTPWDKVKQKQEQERERWAKVAEIAKRQGLVLVQLSSRRYLVVRMGSMGGISLLGTTYHTYLSGEIVHGPDNFDGCRKYIRENTQPLPDELNPNQ